MFGTLRSKELIRGKLLHYLALIYPRSATLQLLQGELDIFGYPVPLEEISFHVAYLEEKQFATIEQMRGPNPRKRMAMVKITAKGIDYYDGRLPDDPGVYLEPQKPT